METAKVRVHEYGYWEWASRPIMTRERMKDIHTKVLLANKPIGISTMDRDAYEAVHVEYNTWAVRVGDYLDELATRPHVPNKQEAKKIRQEKAKQKR